MIVRIAVAPVPGPDEASRPALTWIDIGGATSPGRVREHNEDSFLLKHQGWTNLDQRHEIVLAIVADGMGGYEAGEQASGMAIRTIASTLTPLFGGGLSGQFKSSTVAMLQETIDHALLEANRAIFRKGQSDPRCKGMGATVAVVLAWGRQVLIGHVGDCRVYHQRGGRLTQITRDQTLVARMVELGQLTPEEALTHPSCNEVSQALGKRFDLEAASYMLTLECGDWLIVACDGLHAHVDAHSLQEEIRRAAAAPASYLAQHLVQLSNQRGGTDNCTVVVLHCA
ncbi:MAG: protein phosphatase 2C domain-containing protein [Gemmataceae bacterium]|nr:protein phosphatase 2C domain-containing protein [Gemmataceae bacterium]